MQANSVILHIDLSIKARHDMQCDKYSDPFIDLHGGHTIYDHEVPLPPTVEPRVGQGNEEASAGVNIIFRAFINFMRVKVVFFFR